MKNMYFTVKKVNIYAQSMAPLHRGTITLTKVCTIPLKTNRVTMFSSPVAHVTYCIIYADIMRNTSIDTLFSIK